MLKEPLIIHISIPILTHKSCAFPKFDKKSVVVTGTLLYLH